MEGCAPNIEGVEAGWGNSDANDAGAPPKIEGADVGAPKSDCDCELAKSEEADSGGFQKTDG